MKIIVRPFAGVKDICGFEEREITLFPGCTVEGAVDSLAALFPGLTAIRETRLCPVKEEYADGGRRLAENDTLALFPPVSGG